MQIGVSERTHDFNIYLRCSLAEQYKPLDSERPDTLEIRYGSSVQPASRGIRLGMAATSTKKQLAQRADDASVLLLEIVTSQFKWTPSGKPRLSLSSPFPREKVEQGAAGSLGQDEDGGL